MASRDRNTDASKTGPGNRDRAAFSTPIDTRPLTVAEDAAFNGVMMGTRGQESNPAPNPRRSGLRQPSADQ